jgi:hypothetical protein
MWATALDLHNALLAPLKSLLLHLGNIGAVPNPVPILTFTFFGIPYFITPLHILIWVITLSLSNNLILFVLKKN